MNKRPQNERKTKMETKTNQVEQKRKPGRPKGSFNKKRRGRKPRLDTKPSIATFSDQDIRTLFLNCAATLPISKLLAGWRAMR